MTYKIDDMLKEIEETERFEKALLTSTCYVPDSIVIADLALEIARRTWSYAFDLAIEARLKDDWSADRQGTFVEQVKEIVKEELRRRFE